jgi:hypothetical protein
MNWMSKHATEHKKNLLNEMPIDNRASMLNNNGDGSKLKKKINKLSDKHKGLYDSVIEGYGQNEFTSGNYDKDYKRLGKVEDRLKRKEKRYEEKFGKSPYSMQGPLDKCAKSEGGSGCIKKVGGSWRVESNKTGKLWPAKYKSESSAKAGLRGYHAG